MGAKKIIFVTGTDTGVGKTVLSALLLHHLRQTSIRALAMKPFCSGGLGDVHLLQSLQRGELSDAEMNPFYFGEPVAPLVAREQRRKKIPLTDVLERIDRVKRKCDCLIVEGSGGLLVPLAEGYTVADLIERLDCRVIVGARNQLGTINHTLLTVRTLENFGIRANRLSVVLMSGKKPDLSAKTNVKTIAGLLPKIMVFEVPYLGRAVSTTNGIQADYARVKTILAKLAKRIGLMRKIQSVRQKRPVKDGKTHL